MQAHAVSMLGTAACALCHRPDSKRMYSMQFRRNSCRLPGTDDDKIFGKVLADESTLAYLPACKRDDVLNERNSDVGTLPDRPRHRSMPSSSCLPEPSLSARANASQLVWGTTTYPVSSNWTTTQRKPVYTGGLCRTDAHPSGGAARASGLQQPRPQQQAREALSHVAQKTKS